MSEPRTQVILALTPIAEHALDQLLFGPEQTLEPCASVAEAAELEAEAANGSAQAVLLSPALSGLTGGTCARVRAHGLTVIGVAVDQREHDALAELGVDEIAAADDLDAITTAASNTGRQPERRAFPHVTEHDLERQTGSVVAVVGSKGAPGASECAASVAALAASRWPCLLVELDLLGGSLDLRLGGDPQQGSLLGLVRARDIGAPALGELLERWLTTRPGWPPILLAPTHTPDTLSELIDPGVVAAALAALAQVRPLSIIDVGFTLGDRNEVPALARAHREALVSADAVLLVLGACDQQLRAGLTQLEVLLDELAIRPEQLRVVLNGVGAPGSNSLHALEPSLLGQLGARGLTLDARLPWDARGLARATRAGLPVAIAHRRGRYARAVTALLDELFLPLTPEPKGRKRRLATPRAEQPVGMEEVALPWRN